MQPDDDTGELLASYFDARSIRTDDRSVSTHLDVRDDLVDATGMLRLGAVTYAIDVASGIATGAAVLESGRWVVTTDIDAHLTAPVRIGPLRVDAEVLRAGETTAVSAFTLHDEGADRVVGGGTVTGRPFPFDFDPEVLDVPVGSPLHHDSVWASARLPMAAQLGLRISEDGWAELDIAGWLRNPWGILHGGVMGCLVDVVAEIASSAALGRPARITDQMIRYTAPGRVGPARAVPRVVAADGGRVLVEVRVVDDGADARLLAIASVTSV